MTMAGSQAPRGASFFRYLTCSEEDKKWQLVCTDAGNNDIGPFVPYPPDKDGHPTAFKTVASERVLDEYQIIYVTRGRGVFETGSKRYVVVPGSVFFVFPGVRHHYKPDIESGWNEYWVGFRGPYADTLRAEGLLSEAEPFFEVGLKNGLLSLYQDILELVTAQQPLYQLKTCARISAIIAETLSLHRLSVQYSHAEQLVQKAKLLMDENIYGQINLTRILESLGVSASHLNMVFKSYTAMTPYQYFISIKIHKAKELLETADLSIKEIAFQLGLRDQYYFSRLFKSKTGVSPSQWKRRG